MHSIVKKMQLKDETIPVLILGAPEEYKEVLEAFDNPVHTEPKEESYGFIQVFGDMMEDLNQRARLAVPLLEDDGLLWLSYPKKTSKLYVGSDCSRDTIAPMLEDVNFRPVRQVALDKDWSALRFRDKSKVKKK